METTAIDSQHDPLTAEPAPPPDMTFEWETTVRCRATVSRAKVRELFGLGGTSDEELYERAAFLAANFPWNTLGNLTPYADPARSRSTGARLLTLDGQLPFKTPI